MDHEGPCRRCIPPERKIGCHAECALYAEWKAKHEAELAEIRKKAYLDHIWMTKR